MRGVRSFKLEYPADLQTVVHSVLHCGNRWLAFGDRFGTVKGIDYVDAMVWTSNDGREWAEPSIDALNRLGVRRKNAEESSHRSITGARCLNDRTIAFGWDTSEGESSYQDRDGVLWIEQPDDRWLLVHVPEFSGPGAQSLLGFTGTGDTIPPAGGVPNAIATFTAIVSEDFDGVRCMSSTDLADWTEMGGTQLSGWIVETVTHIDGKWVALAHVGYGQDRTSAIFTSADCSKWSRVSIPYELEDSTILKTISIAHGLWMIGGWRNNGPDRGTTALLASGYSLNELRILPIARGLSDDNSGIFAISSGGADDLRAVVFDGHRPNKDDGSQGSIITMSVALVRAHGLRVPLLGTFYV